MIPLDTDTGLKDQWCQSTSPYSLHQNMSRGRDERIYVNMHVGKGWTYVNRWTVHVHTREETGMKETLEGSGL